MKISVSPEHFVELQKKSYTLDHLYLLKIIEQGYEVSELTKQSMKIEALYNSLIRKGLITEKDKITTLGAEILSFLDTTETKKLQKRKTVNLEFDEWWKTFPGTDTFVHKGKTFTGSRSLKSGKEDCKVKFDKILLEGEYTAKQLIEALKYDVLQKKEASFTSKSNKLSYMQNSLTYLNQRSYESFIELIQQNIEIKETNQFKGTDI